MQKWNSTEYSARVETECRQDDMSRARSPIGRAGTPATISPGATSLVTTEPAPTTDLDPTSTPGRMTQ